MRSCPGPPPPPTLPSFQYGRAGHCTSRSSAAPRARRRRAHRAGRSVRGRRAGRGTGRSATTARRSSRSPAPRSAAPADRCRGSHRVPASRGCARPVHPLAAGPRHRRRDTRCGSVHRASCRWFPRSTRPRRPSAWPVPSLWRQSNTGTSQRSRQLVQQRPVAVGRIHRGSARAASRAAAPRRYGETGMVHAVRHLACPMLETRLRINFRAVGTAPRRPPAHRSIARRFVALVCFIFTSRIPLDSPPAPLR
jgi:hypothetical protein